MTYGISKHKVLVSRQSRSRSDEGHVVVRMVTTSGLEQDLAPKIFRFI